MVVESTFIFTAALICLVTLSNDVQSAKLVMGIIALIALIAFYTAPLSAFVQVIKTRNAGLFHGPLAIASLVNSVLWAIYGVAINDYFIAGPNGLGVVTALLQVVFILVFRKARNPTTEMVVTPEEEENTRIYISRPGLL